MKPIQRNPNITAPPRIPADGFMRLRQILEIVPISKSHWWALVRDGAAPSALKLSPRCTAWLAKDVREFCERMSAKGRPAAGNPAQAA